MKKLILAVVVVLTLAACSHKGERWSEERAWAWYQQQGWLCGCDYIPSTAVNQIEMWQDASFDAPTIERELAQAEELGFNTLRVYLSSVVWENEPQQMCDNMDKFLKICRSHSIRPLFVFFDDCWNAESAIGQQPAPHKGIHNSGWVQDPAVSLRADTVTLFPKLERYVKAVLTRFKDDDRVLMWDLYNEAGNSHHGITSLPLLRNAFKWGREVNPSQPLTSGLWYFDCKELNWLLLAQSDIITYHDYRAPEQHKVKINCLELYNRPLVCTEYMARSRNSRFENVLPMLKKHNIGAINWGFVKGKTNTIFAWDSPMPDADEPDEWFHDIIRPDGTPFDPAEVECIKSLTAKHTAE